MQLLVHSPIAFKFVLRDRQVLPAGWHALTLWEGRGPRQRPLFATPSADSERATPVGGLRGNGGANFGARCHWRGALLANVL